jgi:hypothetical protein
MSGSSSITTNAIDADSQRSGAPNARAVAEYIHDLSTELGLMAERAQLPMLQYLLNMVRIEAAALLKQDGPEPKPPR